MGSAKSRSSVSPSQELVGEIIVRHTHAWDPWTLVSMKTVYREALPSLSKSDDARGWADGRLAPEKGMKSWNAIEVPVYLFGVRTQNWKTHGATECCIMAVSCHHARDGSHAVKLL